MTMDHFSEYKAIQNEINAALETYFTADCPQNELLDAMRYSLLAGGKRIRPLLLVKFCEISGGDRAAALPAACGIEMLHTYSLIHDDLPCMDNDDLRRGKPTCHKMFGETNAVLAGDALQSAAYCAVLSAPAAPERTAAMAKTLAFAAAEQGMCGGQYLDTSKEGLPVTEAELYEIHRLKTGALLRAACVMGVQCAGGTPEQVAAAEEYAMNLGLAFQLQDDYLDVYGDPAVFGKKIGGDILCNKKTYMLINALGRALPADRERLEQWLEKEEGTYAPEEKIAAVTELYDKMGVRALCDEKIRFYFERAREILDKVNLPEERKEPLWEMAQSLLNRKS